MPAQSQSENETHPVMPTARIRLRDGGPGHRRDPSLLVVIEMWGCSDIWSGGPGEDDQRTAGDQ
jgi:hypothetical protein